MLFTTPRRRRSSQQILRKISEFPQDSPAELGYSLNNDTHVVGSLRGVHENRFSNEEQMLLLLATLRLSTTRDRHLLGETYIHV